MKTNKRQQQTEWIWPPADHWITFGFWWVILVGLVISRLFFFFRALTGTEWIRCYVSALIIAAIGISLIFTAKLPLYRSRMFFTFGSRALPEPRRPFYRWGYRCVAFAIALLLCLLLFGKAR